MKHFLQRAAIGLYFGGALFGINYLAYYYNAAWIALMIPAILIFIALVNKLE